jgi:hypothetical protein
MERNNIFTLFHEHLESNIKWRSNKFIIMTKIPKDIFQTIVRFTYNFILLDLI